MTCRFDLLGQIRHLVRGKSISLMRMITEYTMGENTHDPINDGWIYTVGSMRRDE